MLLGVERGRRTAKKVWAFRDPKIRGRNPWLCILFNIVAGWPFSVLWWRWLRPRKDNPESEIDHA